MRSNGRTRKRRRRGGLSVPYARMRPVTDWLVGGANTDNTGAPLTTVSTFDKTGLTIVSGTPMTFQAVVIQPTPATSTPGVGRINCVEVKGSVFITNWTTSGFARIAVGIYVSELNSSTTKWDVRDPLTAADAARDDYFFLHGRVYEISAEAGQTASCLAVEIPLSLPENVVLGGGQALHVTVSMVGPSAATVIGFFRTRIGPIA